MVRERGIYSPLLSAISDYEAVFEKGMAVVLYGFEVSKVMRSERERGVGISLQAAIVLVVYTGTCMIGSSCWLIAPGRGVAVQPKDSLKV